MARISKPGLDYFPLDVNFLQDRKVRRISCRHHAAGIAALTSLLCLIYKEKGYYILWNKDTLFDIAQEACCGEEEMQAIIDDCLSVGLFDDLIYKEYGVLTSQAIQEQYHKIITDSRRKYKLPLEHFWIIKEESSEIEPENTDDSSANSGKDVTKPHEFATTMPQTKEETDTDIKGKQERNMENAEALQREESTLKEIPQRIVDEAFGSVNELLTIDRMGIAVYNETTHLLEYASSPGQEMPEMVQLCFDSREYISEQHRQAIPLMVEAGGEHQCVGVLYLERREGTEQETDRLLFELVARYVAIVVFNAVVKLATKYRDIESAHEETQRASWEDSMLHVQNMVLDNCLSTIKHETIYYPNKIKQIIGRLNAQNLSEKEEKEAVETMTELIEYYKGIFTILSSCASRQLEEVTFRRTTIPVQELFETAGKYFKKSVKNRMDKIELEMAPIDARVIGDVNQLRFLLENLIDEALTVHEDGVLRLQARKDDEYIRFLFTDTRREKSVLELNQLFYPNLARMTSGEKGELRGTEYLVCKQIIRDHDEFAGRRGCRINAEPAEGGGFTVYFTIPRR